MVEINKEHKHNILTEGLIDDVRRSLQSMEIEELIKCVILKTAKEEIFSYGTDLNTLYYYKMSGNIAAIDRYYEKLYNFQHFLASYHKPLIAIGSGAAKGSGAAMLASCLFPLTTSQTSVSFPETGFGYVPDGSSMYYLSKMKGEIGTFMALTGYKISDSGVSGLGLTTGMIEKFDNKMIRMLIEALEYNKYNRSINVYEDGFDKDFEKHKKEKGNINNINTNLSPSEMHKLDFNYYNKVFEYSWKKDQINQDNSPQSENNSALVNDLLNIQKDSKFNLKTYKGVHFTNSLERFENNYLAQLDVQSNASLEIEHLYKDINRLFRYETVDEIVQALSEENTPFANYCLEQISKKSPISLAVTLKMLRNARNMDYSEIISQELNVAKNTVLSSKDFSQFMDNKINKKKTKFDDSYKPSKDEIESYFENNSQHINLDMKPYSLLPNREFINKYPDCFKFMINENKRANAVIREKYDYEIFHYLIQNYGIDMRDTKLSVSEIREAVGKLEKKEKVIAKNQETLLNFLNDRKLVQEYILEKEKIINTVNDEEISNLVDRKIREKFEKNFRNTCKKIQESCTEIQNIEKRRTWLRLRKWVFFNRIMQYRRKSTLIQSKRIEELGQKKFFLVDDINSSFRDHEHPDIKKSPFYQLAGLFKLKNSSPEHMADISNNTIFKKLEINKEKLTEIKHELQSNPDKFLNVWNNALDKEFQKYYDEIENKELLEYERKYRLKNEGQSYTDFLPYKNEYEKLKKNWAEYKAKVMDYLRTVTIELLYDIIKKEENNNNTKLEDYQELYDVLKKNDHEEDIVIESSFDKTQTLRENIKNVITNDELFKYLESDNKYAKQLKEKVITMTQNMIVKEISKDGENITDLEKTIASLFSGTNTDSADKAFEQIYIRYASKGLFSRVLKRSKASVLTSLLSNIENELHDNRSQLVKNLKSSDIVNAIYDKEKLAIEKLLKNYYELKLNLMVMEINEKRANLDSNLYTIDEFIQHMKDITFSQIVLNDEKIPDTLNLILNNNDSEYTKERQFVELYVYLKQSSKGQDDVFKILNSILKNTAWFEQVKQYAASGKVNLNFEDFVDKQNKRKLDENIENFMKSRFNEIIYEPDSQDYDINKLQLDELINSKSNFEYIQSLVSEYRSDSILLNEKIYDQGIIHDENREKKINTFELKLRLIDRINKFGQHYNIENLRLRYTDYIVNKDYYVHRIMTNAKHNMYNNNVQEIIEYGKFLLEVKKKLDSAYSELSKEKLNFNLCDFDYFDKIRQMRLKQETYVDSLEKLNSFLTTNKKYRDIIYEKVYPLLDYTNKYDIVVLTNNPRANIEKLYNTFTQKLKNGVKRVKINYSDYIANEPYLNLIENNFSLDNSAAEFSTLVSSDLNKQVEENVKKLINFEISKINKDVSKADIALDNATHSVLEKEREIFDELVSTGKITEQQRYKQVYDPYINSNEDVLPNKVLSSIYSFKELNKKVVDPANIAKNDIQSLKEFVKENINPGLKFNKIIDLMYGKAKSLRTLIIDEEEKLPNSYLKENEIDSIFNNRLPLDLVKTALDVYDARLIKALKLKLVQIANNTNIDIELMKEKEFKLPFSPFELKNYEKELEIEMKETFDKITPESTPEELKRIKQNVDEIKQAYEEVKDDLVLETDGSALIYYKKGSVFETIVNFNKLDENEQNEAIVDILAAIRKSVNKPDFSDKYSALKYIYDYYMGTLHVFYENHIEDAHVRVNNFNNILFYEKLEKYYFSADNYKLQTGIGAFLNANLLDRSLKNINFEKVYKNTDPVVLERRLENFRKFARELPYKTYMQNIQWIENPDDEVSKFATEQIKKNTNIYYYQNLKDEGILDDTMRRNSAEAMYLTEDFRKKADLVERQNQNMEKLANNVYDEKSSDPVYNKLLNESKPYSNVFEEMFASYFKERKERLAFTKDKLADIKQYANSDNLHKMHYDKLHKSSDNNVELDIDTFIKTNAIYKEYPTFGQADITDIVELDNASSYAQYGKLANLPSWLLIDENNATVDTNVSSEKWLEAQVEDIVNEFFERRSKVERYLTRDELFAMDSDFAVFLDSKNVISQIKQRLNDEVKIMNKLGDAFESIENIKGEILTQERKAQLDQSDFNKHFKNENAAYKSLAYSLRKKVEFENELKIYLSKQKTKSKKHLRRFLREYEQNIDPYSFDNYYQTNLDNSVFREDKDNEKNFSEKKESINLGRSTPEIFSSESEKLKHSENITEFYGANANKSK